MSVSPTAEKNATAKIRWFAMPYLHGRGLDVGCGPEKVLPRAIGVGLPINFSRSAATDASSNGTSLDLFATSALDYVFSSHYLDCLQDWQAALADWWRVLRPGGCLVLYLLHARLSGDSEGTSAPSPGGRGFLPATVLGAMRRVMHDSGGEVLEDEERDEGDEESFFQVYRKREDGLYIYRPWRRHPHSCLVIRWGGYGDALMASSLLPSLKAEGWYVAFNADTKCEEILRHNPHIDELIVTPSVPMEGLGNYWKALGSRYDRVINLSETCEGILLKTPSQADYYWSDDVRRRICAANYVEFQHLVAGVRYELRQRFYATESERAWAREVIGEHPTVLWALAGSAQHKIWPWMGAAIVRLLGLRPDVRILLTGGSGTREKELEQTLFDRVARYFGHAGERFRSFVGKCSIRRSMALAQEATVVVGPETGVLHAVALEGNAKVVLLSHSTALNLTRDWINAVSVEPDTARAPCWPCHRLHHGTAHCPQIGGAAACAVSIDVERVLEPVLQALDSARAHDTALEATLNGALSFS